MKPKTKKCKVCKTEFMPRNSTQKACGIGCAIHLARESEVKKAAKEDKEFKADTRSRREQLLRCNRAHWAKKAQAECNKYIRARDAKKACISCGRRTGCKVNAGHYKSVGAYPELRFHPLNIHLQCEHCNMHLSGNIIEYRPRLIKKIGLKNVLWLEGPHPPANRSVDDLKAEFEMCKRLNKFYA